jgi:iron complex outermembrane recepter protein
MTALGFTAAAVDESPGRTLSLGIPSESLQRALAAFVDQTGLQLVYLSTLAEGKYSQPAPAGLSPPQTLMHMLSGTGIDFVFLNSRTVKLFKVVPSLAEKPADHPTVHVPPQFSALEEVVVTATKREEFLRDVPVSATVMSGEAMNQAGVTNIAEIAAMTPGIE